MHPYTIAIFGEAEKGQFQKPYFCPTLEHLVDFFGNPPEESRGISLAIQILLFNHNIVYFRVQEEGFDNKNYFFGLNFLKSKTNISSLNAIGIPGVGDEEILETVTEICHLHKSFLIAQEKDLYDYLTFQSSL